jgi:hypothetical protein
MTRATGGPHPGRRARSVRRHVAAIEQRDGHLSQQSLIVAAALLLLSTASVAFGADPAPAPSVQPSPSSSAQPAAPPAAQPAPANPPPQQPATPESPAALPVAPAEPDESTGPNKPKTWLDQSQTFVYDSVWRSAMWFDRMFGSRAPDVAYAQASGSIAPAILWDQFNGFRELLRFHADVPLPQLNDRFSAFIGRVNPAEYVSESARNSGAFPNSLTPTEQDQTLLGISYAEPARQGYRFDAGAGVHIALPFDPYIKGSFIYERGMPSEGVFGAREILFWQNSQGGFGATTRLDYERLASQSLLMTVTGSTTIAQRTFGWASYGTFDAYYALPGRRALALELSIDGSSHAPVPIHDYGYKIAFRRSVFRDWLVLEVRTSLDWPKVFPYQHRSASFGVGVGFEMFFGTDQFLARPVTF